MLFVEQISFKSVFLQLENVSDLFNFLIFNGLKLDSDLLSDLDGLSSGNVGILQNIDI